MAHNVQTEVKGNKMVITVDISPPMLSKAPMSSSNKNKLVASSGGYLPIDGSDFKISLNVITKA